MPQEGRRTMGFRLFITCEDPKGVVECGTTRKHSTIPTQDGKYDQRYKSHRRLHKNDHSSKEMVINSASLRHLEVSRKARKLSEDPRKRDPDLGDERKNCVLSDPSSEETSDDRILLDSSDLPSTSSSQSSVVFSTGFVSPDTFLSSTFGLKKKREKRLSLIAKLKGVEEAFLRTFPYSFWKNGILGERVLNHRNLAFDHDSPTDRKHKSDDLERSGSRKMKPSFISKHSELSYLNKWSCADRRPPIVIMKPAKYSCLNSEQPIMPKSKAQVDEEMLLQLDKTLNINESFRKAKQDQGPMRNLSWRHRCGDVTILKEKSEAKSRPQKMNGRRGKRTTKCKRHLQPHEGNNLSNSKYESLRGSNSAELDMQRSATIEYRRKGSKQVTEYTSEAENKEYVSETLMATNDCGTTFAAKKSLKGLLLSSPMFMNRVDELFDFKVDINTDLMQQQQTNYDHSERLLLDCANEIMERHKMRSAAYYHTSLDQLLVEVCDGVEDLRHYGEVHGNSHSTASSLLLIEGDLSRGMMCGVWDVGWTSAGFADEIEEMTRLVDELVFGGLLKEILVDLTL